YHGACRPSGMKSSENTTLAGVWAATGAGMPATSARPHIPPAIDRTHRLIVPSLARRTCRVPPSCHREKQPVNRFSKIYLLVEIISDIPESAPARSARPAGGSLAALVPACHRREGTDAQRVGARADARRHHRVPADAERAAARRDAARALSHGDEPDPRGVD